jgi:putative hemolysin
VTSDLALLVLLIILSAVFSGAEIALTSLSPAKVRAMKGEKKFASSAIVRLKKKPQNLLVTILIGNNIVNILATVIATLWGLQVFGDNAAGIVTGGLTFIILVFGEITPKTFAQKFAEPFSRVVAYPLLWLIFVLWPIIWIFEKYIAGLMKLLKAEKSFHSLSEEELLAMVDMSTEEGVIEEHEQELIENVLEFDATTVEEVMTIEKNIECLEASTSINDAAHFIITHSHSRIPVYEKDLNNIIGILTVHDILRLTHHATKKEKIADLDFSKVILVPKTKTINALFKEFKKRRQHIAMVVDEHGKTVGLVTLEDILEEIVGEIVDEIDEEKTRLHKIDNVTWETPGDTPIEDVNDVLGIQLDFPEHQTVGLLILKELNRFPKHGEKIPYHGVEFQVKDMSRKKIEKVIITKLN